MLAESFSRNRESMMSTRKRLEWLGAGCFALIALFSAAGVQALADDDEAAEAKESAGRLKARVFNVEQSTAGYYIGVMLDDIDEAQREKLKLKAPQGLAIEQVVPNSPAAKAGLTKGDIVVSVNDAPVKSVAQVSAAIAASKGKAIELGIVHNGKRKSIEVKPAKQAAGERRVIVIGERGEKGEEGEERKERGERKEPQKKPEAVFNPYRGWFGAGGLVARSAPGRLPDDMQVTIQKRGAKPARVTVKQGEKLWRTTESQLDMLPAEARAYVAGLLNKRPAANPGRLTPRGGSPQGFRAAPQGLQFRLDAKSQPSIKVVPKGGIKVEIEESGEVKPAAKWLELKRAEPGRAGATEHRVHELQEIVQQLRRELEKYEDLKNSRK